MFLFTILAHAAPDGPISLSDQDRVGKGKYTESTPLADVANLKRKKITTKKVSPVLQTSTRNPNTHD